jgi:hypothetical protein
MVIIVAVPIMNVPIVEEEKNQIRQYLLGQLAEADEERLELRLMSDSAFSEEFDIVVDEIATLYVSGELKDDEKARVEQYFLRSPERQLKVQFICELLNQLDPQPVPASAASSGSQETVWQRVNSFWTGQPAAFRPAITFAVLLIVGGLVFYVISLNSKSTYATLELSLTSADRSAGTEITQIPQERVLDGLQIKLNLPTPRAPQYRAALRGEQISLPQLTIEAQDTESITVLIPRDQISKGTYAIELSEINNGSENPIRGAYVFAVN